MNKRSIQYDLIRVSAMFMVICLHTEALTRTFVDVNDKALLFANISKGLFISSNYLFFMLSGKFALYKQFNGQKDYYIYYIKKIFSIIVPFLGFSYLLFCIYNRSSIFDFGLFYTKLISLKVEGVYWFIYSIIPLYLSAPFLSKMVHSMNKTDKKNFLILGLAVEAFSLFHIMIQKENAFTLGIFPFMEWAFCFTLGSFIEELFDEKGRKKMMLLGLVSFVLKLICQYIRPEASIVAGNNVLMTLEVIGIYFFLLDVVKIKNDKVASVITWVAKYSFMVYLIHPIFLMLLRKGFDFNVSFTNNLIFLPFGIIIVLVGSLFVGFIFENCLFKHTTKLGNKLCEKVKTK